jgi:REP element-mobilizing transposase RayT
MARPKRLKLKDEEGFFHIMSRTVGQEFYLGDVEKEKLFNIIKYYSGFYFVKPIGLTVMSNHFHLLIKSEPESYYSDDQVKQRIAKYLDKKNKKKKKYMGKKEEGEELGEVEEGEALINCLAYIDLNPVRAGIVKKPEDYRWSGIIIALPDLYGK